MDDLHQLAAQLGQRIAQGDRLWMFLDYDGTLADFAPTPEVVLPDAELIDLLRRLVVHKDQVNVVVLSGRSLSNLLELLPIPGLMAAGTYGIEYRTWLGETVHLLDFDSQRPFLDHLRERWQAVVADQPGFFLEDKGFALALHARCAEAGTAKRVITEVEQIARQEVDAEVFSASGNDRFFEVAPLIATKGQSVSLFLKHFGWDQDALIVFGDEPKDESAFEVVRQHQGDAVLVSAVARPTAANHRLPDPQAVRQWLEQLLAHL